MARAMIASKRDRPNTFWTVRVSGWQNLAPTDVRVADESYGCQRVDNQLKESRSSLLTPNPPPRGDTSPRWSTPPDQDRDRYWRRSIPLPNTPSERAFKSYRQFLVIVW